MEAPLFSGPSEATSCLRGRSKLNSEEVRATTRTMIFKCAQQGSLTRFRLRSRAFPNADEGITSEHQESGCDSVFWWCVANAPVLAISYQTLP